VFFGKFYHRLNSKNQVTVPASFRQVIPPEEAKKGLYLVRTNQNCLYLYTQSEVEQIMTRLRESSTPEDQDFRRMLASRITPVDMDSQGRIVIPAELKAAVGIDTDVAFVGNANRAEIWALDRWRAFEREHEGTYERRLEERMDDLFER